MTENEDLDPVAGQESDLDADLFDEDGWDEDFEADSPQTSQPPRSAGLKPSPAAKVPVAVPVAATVPLMRRDRRAAGPDLRGVMVAAATLVVALPVTLGVFSGVRTSPATLVGLTPEAKGVSLPFLLGVVVTLALAVGAGIAFTAWTRRFSQKHAADQALLAAIAGLDLEDARGWQAPVLVADPAMAALTERLLGTYRLQQAKLTRYVCLDGELHRLGKALACSAREDLEGQWDNVAVGTAADEALRIIDRLAVVETELAAAQKQIADAGPDLVSHLAEARAWTTTAVEQVNAQGAAIERLLVKLGRVAEAANPDDNRARTRQEQVIAAIRQDLAEAPARGARPHAEATATLTRLVDRASKLAFQIAMEVARLAGKNERLLPMTQDLEELTTELRGVVSASGDGESPDRTGRVLENVRGRIAELATALAERAEESPNNAQVITGELTPAARQVATALQQVSRGISGQIQRLDQLLQLASNLTGIDIPATATVEAAIEPGNSLLVDRFDPFHTGRPGEGPGILADPFANSRSVFNPGPIDSDFCQSTLPGLESTIAAPSPLVDDIVVATPAVTFADEPAPALPPALDLPSVAASPTIAELDDDLVENAGAPFVTALDEEATQDEVATLDVAAEFLRESPADREEDRIYDLSEFDAERLAPADARTTAFVDEESAEERVFDLAEFDAVAL